MHPSMEYAAAVWDHHKVGYLYRKILMQSCKMGNNYYGRSNSVISTTSSYVRLGHLDWNTLQRDIH